MAPSRKNVIQAAAAVPNAPKGKGKAIEAPEPADHQTNPSDVHIHDEEDSYSFSATPLGALGAKHEPQHTSEQLHQMLLNIRK